MELTIYFSHITLIYSFVIDESSYFEIAACLHDFVIF
jgi:hypothetical protein